MTLEHTTMLPARTFLSLVLMLAAAAMPVPAATQEAGSAARVGVDVRLSRSGVVPGNSVEAAVVLDIEEGWHANAREPTLEYLIGTTVDLESTDNFSIADVRYPEPEVYRFGFAGDEELAVYSGKTPIFLNLHAAEDVAPGRHVLDGSLSIQICDDAICLPPSTLPVVIPLTIVSDAAASQSINQNLFSDAADADAAGADAEGADPRSTSDSEIASLFDQRGLLLAFLGIFVIGLALNLTPCVYPMLSVTVSLFGTREDDRLARSFGRASVYVLGIATMYSVLGATAAYTGGLFGAALQSPPVLASIGVLLLLLALSMFGVYQLQVPAALQTRLRAADQVSGLLGLYLSGLVVGVFAAPCIGPPIVALLAFVGARGEPLFGLAAFGVLGLGLGTPYLLLGTFSGLLGRLPRSGVWMVWVEKLFGVVMVGAALFYLGLAFVPRHAVYAVPATLIGGGLYLGFLERSGRERTWFTRIKWGVGTAAVLFGLYSFQHLQKPTMAWAPYSEQALSEAQVAARPVLLDFHADWCIPCIELDRVTFTREQVIAATEDFARIKVDLTHYDAPASQAVRERFEVAGVPTLVFLDENGSEIPDSRVVGFMGPDRFLEHISMVEEAARP